MTAISYAVFPDPEDDKAWYVKSLAGDGDEYGDFVVRFSGPNSHNRAREYSTWKNVFAGGSKHGINAGAYAI